MSVAEILNFSRTTLGYYEWEWKLGPGADFWTQYDSFATTY